MAKLDRLGWAAGLAFRAYGLRLGVRVNRAEVLEQVRACLPPGWTLSPTPVVDHLYSLFVGGLGQRPNVRPFHLLYTGAFRLGRSLILGEVLDLLETDLRLSVADLARRRLFVHAGVVGWQGRALVLPGRSHCGKTTLVAALLRAGATYYSDEYAVFDEHGRVHPFARPLSLRVRVGQPPRRCPPQEFGADVGVKPLPVGLVALAHYRPGGRWQPRPLSPGQAVLGLLEHTVPARRRPEKALAVLQQVAARGKTVKGFRGEAEDVAGALLDQLARATPVVVGTERNRPEEVKHATQAT